MAQLERLAIPAAQAPDRLRWLKAVPGVQESFLLSTCNRVEIYVALAAEATPGDVVAEVTDALAAHSGIAGAALRDLLVVGVDDVAVRHLLTVACGLDSMVIGEYQIVAQVREALRAAEEADAVGHVLGTLVRCAIRTSKRARTQTGIGSAGTSMMSVGLDWAAETLDGLGGRAALLVGAGRMGQLAGSLLRQAEATPVFVANRTFENAARLADRFGAVAVPLERLAEADALAEVDIVVSSTGSPGYVISAAQVAAAAARRPDRPLFLLDLALPRDVEPAAREVPGVTVVDVEAIAARLRHVSGADELGAARSIVDDGVREYLQWRGENQIAPLIAALRAVASGLVDAEVRRLHDRLPQLDHRAKRETDAAMRRAVGKLIHTPTVRVKALATAPGGAIYSEALAALFDLEAVGE